MRRISLLCLALVCAATANTSAAAAEDQAAYTARCKRELIAQYPNAKAQADSICKSNWDQIVISGPMADAMIALAPAAGAPFDAAAVRTQGPSVKWNAKPRKGFTTSGQLSDIDVNVLKKPAVGVQFDWFKDGEPIPFRLEDSLTVRGVELKMIGCLAFGASESTHVFRVTPAGKAPFALTIYERGAAVASQSSTFSATTDFSGRFPTLATLKKDGNDWTATCPQ